MSRPPLLEVSDLTTTLGEGGARVVDSVSFTVDRGERVAIVGESGSGKSTLALSLIGLAPPGMGRVAGRVVLDGEDTTTMTERRLRDIRGGRIGSVFQDAFHALDPVATIGEQIAAVARRHRPGIDRRTARSLAVELLGDVGFPSPEEFLRRHPHELSGGMRQRALIAAALAGHPDLLVADEPTSALDVTVQAQIIDLLVRLSTERRLAVLLITHDLSLVAGFAHRTLVMYGGRVVEGGDTAAVFDDPRHPYTSGLLACVPRLDDDPQTPLPTIPGSPPALTERTPGCSFASRCSLVHERCHAEEPTIHRDGTREVACHLAERSGAS